MNTQRSLFNNLNACEFCKRPLPLEYPDSLCPACKETKLFQDVKDFIRKNDVNEYEVSEHFQIPVKQVKSWIREGRIEYKEKGATPSIAGLHCQHCGAPVSFGTLCSKCLKLINGNKGYMSNSPLSDNNNNKMRFLDQDK